MQTNFAVTHLIFFAPVFVALAATFIFWIWSLVDCVKNPRLEGTSKALWILVLILGHGIGAIVYYFAARSALPTQQTGGL